MSAIHQRATSILSVRSSVVHGQLSGTSGDDLLVVAEADGPMLVEGLGGADRIFGGYGADHLIGCGDDDFIVGNWGDDVLSGGDGEDSLMGNDGADQLFGGDGDDILAGDGGNDLLCGDEGNDFIEGDGDHDVLFGDAGDDWLFGGDGDDVLAGGVGNDVLNGGPGDDIFMFSRGDGCDVISAPGADLPSLCGSDEVCFVGLGADELVSLNWQMSATGRDDLAVRYGEDDVLVIHGMSDGGDLSVSRFRFDGNRTLMLAELLDLYKVEGALMSLSTRPVAEALPVAQISGAEFALPSGLADSVVAVLSGQQSRQELANQLHDMRTPMF